MNKWYKLYSNILYLHFSDGFYKLPESAKNAVSPTKGWMRLLRMAGYTVVRLLGNLLKSEERPEELKGKVWLYVLSQNNYDSLKFIQEAIPEAILVAGQRKEIGSYNGVVNRISLRSKILYYYKFFPLLFNFLRRKPQSTRRFFDLIYDAVGFYEVYLKKLQQYKPACIIFANDHNADARAMLLAANASGIKTAYIQHSSVSTLFPPLQFDLNLLEGQDSLDKYKACGPVAGEVKLVGMPKADDYVKYRNSNTTIKSIGIGCNLMDLTEEIKELVQSLLFSLPDVTIVLRPHPRDKRDFSFIKDIAPSHIIFSDSNKESAFKFLQRIDVQISGNSGIHLEAVLLNVWSIYINLNPSENLYDYYGFISNNLVDAVTDREGLINLLRKKLNSKPDVYLKAQYYNATVGTQYDGSSSKLALKYLADFIYQYIKK
ncbi:hypothetical protein ACFSKU_02400 [Pontibacter silvestris]|uniref:Surface carbohydrate biosynthesis protein n=1 Tax=Pontibacter silvestris TaxID=2305183 RepID=A0ABW4WSL1_9BACT|nr:hypothetical protein [Pontibacter silvestris]MCC9137754.1 hypothetical protein [Pontibacter silvestris]